MQTSLDSNKFGVKSQLRESFFTEQLDSLIDPHFENRRSNLIPLDVFLVDLSNLDFKETKGFPYD